MWSAAACRRLCDLARYCRFNEARQALQEKAVAQLPHSIFISAHCSVIEHGAMVFLFWRHSNNRWRSEDRLLRTLFGHDSAGFTAPAQWLLP